MFLCRTRASQQCITVLLVAAVLLAGGSSCTMLASARSLVLLESRHTHTHTHKVTDATDYPTMHQVLSVWVTNVILHCCYLELPKCFSFICCCRIMMINALLLSTISLITGYILGFPSHLFCPIRSLLGNRICCASV